MSKEFSNDKGITSKHDDRVNLLKDKRIRKLNRKSVTGSMTGEIYAKRVVVDSSLKHQEDLDGSANQAVEAPNKFWIAQIIRETEINGL